MKETSNPATLHAVLSVELLDTDVAAPPQVVLCDRPHLDQKGVPQSAGDRVQYFPYHWKDQQKRSRDYHYLAGFYERFVPELAELLDHVHQIKRSNRYWEILAGAWAVHYLSVVFDRWERLRLAQELHGPLLVKRPPGPPFPPVRVNDEFHTRAGFDPFFNQHLLCDLAETIGRGSEEPFSKPALRPLTTPTENHTASRDQLASRPRLKSFVGTVISTLLRPTLNQKAVFYLSYFPRLFLTELQLRLRQVPMPYYKFSGAKTPCPTPSNPLRTRLASSVEIRSSFETPFEKFVWANIPQHLPTAAVEDFPLFLKSGSTSGDNPRVMITAIGHWADAGFQVWVAEQVEKGARLVVCEHGGSFPAKEYVFGFEERIADVYVPSFLPYHPKHRQLPPTKYAASWKNLNRKSAGGDGHSLLVVPCFGHRFTIRASSHPNEGHHEEITLHLKHFIEALAPQARAALVLKAQPSARSPHYDYLMRLYRPLVNDPGQIVYMPLEKAFRRARVNVCTYPQSTFAEAMLSGVPTILLYDPALHGLNPVSDAVIDIMHHCGIIHFDPKKAAEKVTEIWSNPRVWWDAPAVSQARKEYFSATCVNDPKSAERWTSFLEEQISLSVSQNQKI